MLDYLGQTGFIHIATAAGLTLWFFFGLNFSMKQYTDWWWQGLIVALYFNIYLSFCIRWFVPRWRKKIGYRETNEVRKI